jgi:hypothetical protein
LSQYDDKWVHTAEAATTTTTREKKAVKKEFMKR